MAMGWAVLGAGRLALIVVSAARGLGSSVQSRRVVRLAAARTGSVLQRGRYSGV